MTLSLRGNHGIATCWDPVLNMILTISYANGIPLESLHSCSLRIGVMKRHHLIACNHIVHGQCHMHLCTIVLNLRSQRPPIGENMHTRNRIWSQNGSEME